MLSTPELNVYDQKEMVEMKVLLTRKEDRIEEWLKWIFICD